MTSFSAKPLHLFATIISLGFGAAYGQTLFAPNGTVSTSTNGNVGIGTATPAQKLTIHARHGDTQLRMFSDEWGQGIDGANTALLSLWASEPGWTWGGVGIGNNVTDSGGIVRVTNSRGGSYIRLLDNTMYFSVVDSSGNDRNGITVNSAANIGIGTTTPTGKLHIAQPGGGAYQRASDIIIQRTDAPNTTGKISFVTNGGISGTRWEIVSDADIGNDFGFSYSGAKVLQILSSGNVGIGTTNPTHKLAVNGTIKAKEVIVETTGWSDYVFADDYSLASLSEVEAHIKEHKHLPGIPSAVQVAEHGVSVGDMQARLLAKIEELTLHQIAQEKRALEQEKRLAAQDIRIEALETENTRLKTQLR